MSKKEVFLLANCFNNYDIVAGKVIQFYIENAVKSMGEKNTSIKTFFEDTPFGLYSTQMNPGPSVYGELSSKQFQMFIIILSLTAVCLARINNAYCTVYINNGVVDVAGFSSLFAIANTLNKPTVFWNDDMRSTWGVSTDPLVLGTVPNFYRNLYNASSLNNSTAPYIKNMNNSLVLPSMGTDFTCPTGNIFINMIKDSLKNVNSTEVQNLGNTYIANLIKLGDKIIKYVEVDKKIQFPTLPIGWNIGFNPGLYYDLRYIISLEVNSETSLICQVQKDYFKNNFIQAKTTINNLSMKMPKSNIILGNKDKILNNMMGHINSITNGNIPSNLYFR